MQRLLSFKQLSSSTFSKATTKPSSSLPYKTFSSIAKPTLENQFTNSPFSHQFDCRSFTWRSMLGLKGFLSNPVVTKRLWLNFSNTHLKISGKSLLDCRVWFLRAQIPKERIDFGFQNRPRRAWFQRLTVDDMIWGLIMTNVSVYMLWRIADRKFMMNNFMVSLDNFKSGRLHTLITSAFSHIDLEHIASNMIGLYFFGSSVGRMYGPEYLLKLYLAGAIGGSVFYLVNHALLALSSKGQAVWMMDPSRKPGLGASGAVNAIMLLDIFLNPKATIYLQFIIPVPAMLLGIFLIGMDIWRIREGNSHISGSAHLGGAAVAAIAWARLRRGRF